MKKISLKNLNLKEVEQLSKEQLKEVLGGFLGGSEGSGCGENQHYDQWTSTCVCNPGYYFSSPHGACVEATGSGPDDPTPKITACIGKDEFDPCSFIWQGRSVPGACRYRGASELYCSDSMFV